MFTIDRFDGSKQPIQVDHAVTLKQTGLTWVGQYYSQFGEHILENMLHLSENFAGPNPPSSVDDNSATFDRLLGQLWYDTDDNADKSNRVLKIQNDNGSFNTNGWKRVELILNDTLPTTFTNGESFFKTDRRTLYVSDNGAWREVKVETAYDSEKLIGIDGIYYMRKDIDQTMLGLLTTKDIVPLTTGSHTLGKNGLRWKEAYLDVLNTTYTRDLIPLSDKTFDLGSNTRRWDDLYVNVVRADNFTDVIPLSNNSYDLGSNTKQWDNLHTRTAYIDRYDTILPIDTTRSIGRNTNRWNQGFFNELNINTVTSNILPRAGSTTTIGGVGREWNELYVNTVKSTQFETLLPKELTTDIGTSSDPFNKLYVRELAIDKFTQDINFDIIRNAKSKGIVWSGLTDNHSIYVEEVDNNEKTRLVIENRDNPNQDTTVFKHRDNDILEVGSNKVESNRDVQFNEKANFTKTSTNRGVTMEFNETVGAIEFKFY